MKSQSDPVAAHFNLYETLGVSRTATTDEIRASFRRSALQHHPDRNDGSPESAARFRVIYNAYAVLSDALRRSRYDSYLRTSVFAGADDTPLDASRVSSMGSILSHLNVILWDVEDIVRARPDWDRVVDGAPLSDYLLRILRFIDRWVLGPAGYPDYFYQARQMSAPSEIRVPIHDRRAPPLHRPFVNLEDYFYNIRRRTDRFLGGTSLEALMGTIPESEVRLVDCVLEAHNHGAHYLGHIQDALSGAADSIPPFRHSNPCFTS